MMLSVSCQQTQYNGDSQAIYSFIDGVERRQILWRKHTSQVVFYGVDYALLDPAQINPCAGCFPGNYGSEVIVKVNCKSNHPSFVVVAAVTLLFSCAAFASAQEGTPTVSATPASGSLSEIANKRRVLLVVTRATVVDVSNDKRSILEEATRANPQRSRRYRLAFNTIARKLNGYIKRYKSMRPVDRVEDADYIIFFNLLEYRWPLGTPYPYGELFVIANREPATQTPAHIVWQSKKVQWAEDAVKDLIDDLRLVQVAR